MRDGNEDGHGEEEMAVLILIGWEGQEKNDSMHFSSDNWENSGAIREK